jgi:hypothetical protein
MFVMAMSGNAHRRSDESAVVFSRSFNKQDEMKKLLSAVGVLALCLTFASCDKEDEEANELMGIWKLVSVNGESTKYSGTGEWLVFNKDNSAMYYHVDIEWGWYRKGKLAYQVGGNKITIDDDDAEIVKLTSSELIIKYVTDYYEESMTFKKVSALPDLGKL